MILWELTNGPLPSASRKITISAPPIDTALRHTTLHSSGAMVRSSTQAHDRGRHTRCFHMSTSNSCRTYCHWACTSHCLRTRHHRQTRHRPRRFAHHIPMMLSEQLSTTSARLLASATGARFRGRKSKADRRVNLTPVPRSHPLHTPIVARDGLVGQGWWTFLHRHLRDQAKLVEGERRPVVVRIGQRVAVEDHVRAISVRLRELRHRVELDGLA